MSNVAQVRYVQNLRDLWPSSNIKKMQAPLSQCCQYYEGSCLLAWEKIRHFSSSSPVIVFAIKRHSPMYNHKQTPKRKHKHNKQTCHLTKGPHEQLQWPSVTGQTSWLIHKPDDRPNNTCENNQYADKRTENTIHNSALVKSNNELGCLYYLIMPCCGDKLDKWEWRIHHHHRRHHHHHDEDYDGDDGDDGDDDDDDDHDDDRDHDSDNMTKVMIMMRRMTMMLMTTTAAMSQNVSHWREESRWNTTEVQNDDAEQHATNWK